MKGHPDVVDYLKNRFAHVEVVLSMHSLKIVKRSGRVSAPRPPAGMPIAAGSPQAAAVPIGPVVRVELQHGGEIVEVELSRERHESLQLAVGQAVWFRPRQMRVFGADNQPAVAPEKQAFLF